MNMQYILSGIVSLVVSVGGFFGLPHFTQEPVVEQPVTQAEVLQMMEEYIDQAMEGPLVGATYPIAGQTFTLAGSGVSQTGTSITLSSFTVTQTGQKIRDQDLSDTFYITLEPGNSAKQEIVSCTTVVQNANNSATLSGCTRGLSPITPYTASTTLRFSHGGGTSVIFSNPPQFYNDFLQLQNAATSSAVLVIGSTTPWRYDYNPNFINYSSTTLASIGYVASTSYSGTVDANDTTKGIVEMATGAEAAAGTILGGTGARVALGAGIATSTCQSAANSVLVSVLGNGKLSDNCVDKTAAYNWSALHVFGASASSTRLSVFDTLYVGGSATSTIQGSATGTSTIQGFVNVTGTNSTSTFSGNLAVNGNSTTTSLSISQGCVGCPMFYTSSSTSFSNSSGATTYTGSIPALANTAIGEWRRAQTGGGDIQDTFTITRSGFSTLTIDPLDQEATDCVHTIAFSGNNLVVTETSDGDNDCSLTGTIYYYK